MKRQYTKAGATLFALLMLLASAGVVRAQEAANPLTVSYQNLTLMRDTARAKKQAATVVAPNDTLRYTLKFTNTQSRAVTNVVFLLRRNMLSRSVASWSKLGYCSWG